MRAKMKASKRKAASPGTRTAATRRPSPPLPVKATSPKAAPPLTRAARQRARRGRGEPLRIPHILREGDTPGSRSPLSPSKPGAGSPAQPQPEQFVQSLPEAYGTRELRLIPRDPNWIHAHWDFTREQLQQAQPQSAPPQLALRLFQESTQGPLVSESTVQPDATRWMMHAPKPATAYTAQLGYYDGGKTWCTLATAPPVRTPPLGVSSDVDFERATLTPAGQLERPSPDDDAPPPPLLPAPHASHEPSSFGSLPAHPASSFAPITGFPGSIASAPASQVVSSWSSLQNAGLPSSWKDHPHPARFRFEVNAELIVHGATEPNATVRMGDRTIHLSADGTFRLRFSFPEGAHELNVTAVSMETGEARAVHLHFDRRTAATGDVGTAAPAPGLQPPSTENL